ncbi:MAG: hypothetical protein ACTSQB_00575 [Candidatus Heimdallarchaeota archaeon]
MAINHLTIGFLVLVFIQVLHIFEEIAMEVYVLLPKGSVLKYLLVASGLVALSMGSLLLIIFELVVGYYFGLFVAIIAIVNFLVHTVGLIKKRKMKGTLAGGFFTGILLGGMGVFVLILLIQTIIAS